MMRDVECRFPIGMLKVFDNAIESVSNENLNVSSITDQTDKPPVIHDRMDNMYWVAVERHIGHR